jgi:hypothetical protein
VRNGLCEEREGSEEINKREAKKMKGEGSEERRARGVEESME